jgi:hypothetical protein
MHNQPYDAEGVEEEVEDEVVEDDEAGSVCFSCHSIRLQLE